MTHEELLGNVNKGTNASVCLATLGPVLDQCHKELVDSLKASFREGKYTELVLACHTAQLVALDDIKNKLTAMTRTGQTSFDQIQNKEFDTKDEEGEYNGE